MLGFVALVVEPISPGLDSDVELAGRRIKRESRWSTFLSLVLRDRFIETYERSRAAAGCDPLILCPNDAIALPAAALPDRMLDKPGAPVGMLKFQFDPLPTHYQQLWLKLPQTGAECTELAIR